MKTIIIKSSNQDKATNVYEWLVYILGYSLVLITASVIFPKTIYIDNGMFGLFAFLAAILIYGLNKIIKPFLVFFTLPITALTFGLFYPFINVFILKIVDLLMGDLFFIDGFIMGFVVSIFISIMNYVMKTLIVSPVLQKNKQGVNNNG